MCPREKTDAPKIRKEEWYEKTMGECDADEGKGKTLHC